MVEGAWLTARLGRVKKMPRLEKLLAQPPTKKPRLTREQADADWRTLRKLNKPESGGQPAYSTQRA